MTLFGDEIFIKLNRGYWVSSLTVWQVSLYKGEIRRQMCGVGVMLPDKDGYPLLKRKDLNKALLHCIQQELNLPPP